MYCVNLYASALVSNGCFSVHFIVLSCLRNPFVLYLYSVTHSIHAARMCRVLENSALALAVSAPAVQVVRWLVHSIRSCM